MPRPPDTPGMHGVLVIAKPAGPTSHDVVALVRRLAGTRRIGHGGTLDPFAAGVLPLFLGGATRLAEYHLGAEKQYRATICFGASSSTDDLDGELTPGSAPAPGRAAVEAALHRFTGTQQQRPPDYSAVQVGGRRAYALARAGQAVELPPRDVTIASLEIVDWDESDPSRPVAVVDVRCSAGTYIRALARDLGASLGSGAYLGALVRTASGPFDLASAHALDAIREAAAASGSDGIRALLLPPDAGLDDMPAVTLSGTEVADVAQGRFVRPAAGLGAAPDGATLRLLGPDGVIVGLGRRDRARVAPTKILARDDRPGARPGRRGATGVVERNQPGASDGAHGDGAASDGPPAADPPAAGARGETTDAGAELASPGVRNGMAVVPGVAAMGPELGRLFVVVGVFDGLHLGHAYLLERLVAEAAMLGARPTVITFDHHPDEILTGSAPPLLCDPDERLDRLAAAGVAITVVQHFDLALRMTPFDVFVRGIAERVDLAGFLMTPDSAFGYERGGTPASVAALGEELGYGVVLVPAFSLDGEPVRSTDIRGAIAAGDLARASRLLGRPVSVTGHVAPGAPGVARFTMPVALPPPGDYPVGLERPGEPARSAVAAVDDTQVRIGTSPAVTPGAVRITFGAG